MDGKPQTSGGYPPELIEEARRMVLHLATILGDLSDDTVFVGGLVPALIVDQARVEEPHVGTRDVDLGLSIGVLNEERYREISRRLRDRGFHPALTPAGNERRQTWQLRDERITVDFLIGPTPDGAAPGRIQHLEGDFAAFVTPALPLAFIDTVMVTLDGETSDGERVRRTVRVAGPAAFVVLKALAFRMRGENKDAYDLIYVLLNFGPVPFEELAARFVSIAHAPEAQEALAILVEDFATDAHVGPKRRAAFLGNREDEVLRQDAVGAVWGFLDAVRRRDLGKLQ